jgi:2-polyprenyl-3-methyl-5-hydroxy-6-metoxy-1,4-benzoquinol methylase
MHDFPSLLFGSQAASISHYFAPPKQYNGLFGYEPLDLVRAAAHFADAQRWVKFADSAQLLEQIGNTVAIEKLALRLRSSLLGSLQVNGAQPANIDVFGLVALLYADYMKVNANEVKQRFLKSHDDVLEAWKQAFSNEADVSPEAVEIFYANLPFPVGCRFSLLSSAAINIAYHGLALHVLDSAQGAVRVFDYGGNSGMVSSAMATHPRVVESLLIEPRENLREFARWRDQKCGIRNVRYLAPQDLPTENPQPCDLGVCIEVLEHVHDVEAAVRNLSNLLKPGGVLFLQASFSNPHLTSLRKNVAYAGREDELMRSVGLERIHFQLPLRLLNNQGFYRKPQ